MYYINPLTSYLIVLFIKVVLEDKCSYYGPWGAENLLIKVTCIFYVCDVCLNGVFLTISALLSNHKFKCIRISYTKHNTLAQSSAHFPMFCCFVGCSALFCCVPWEFLSGPKPLLINHKSGPVQRTHRAGIIHCYRYHITNIVLPQVLLECNMTSI